MIAAKAMKGIYLRGKTYWFARQIDKKRHFISLETEDLAEAIQRATLIRNEVVLESGELIRHCVDRYITRARASGDWTLSTERAKGYTLRRWAEELGDVTPASVTTEQIREYHDRRIREGKSPTTTWGNIMTIQGFFRWAVDVERCARTNPVIPLTGRKSSQRIRAPKLTARLDFCSHALRDKLIAECPREDLKFVLYCGFHAGLRRQEIVEARAFWFDLDNGLLHLRKHDGLQFKDGEERTIPMTAEFRGFVAAFGLHEPYMLHPKVKARRKNVYRWDFRRPFEEYMKIQGCPWVTAHIMRHTFASLLASDGVSIFKIARWLGDDVRVVQAHDANLLPGDQDIENSFSRRAHP